MFRFQYILYRICVNLIGLGFSSMLISGIGVKSFYALMSAALILTFFQTFLRPVLVFLTLPFQILSLGIGYFLINALLLKLTAHFITGLTVSDFWSAFLGSLIISLINMIFDSFSSQSRFKIYYYRGGKNR